MYNLVINSKPTTNRSNYLFGMTDVKPIRSALISAFCKDGIADIATTLNACGVTIYSTGGTLAFLRQLGIEAQAVETLTGCPAILGGRVKTLHPKVFGGILARRSEPQDMEQLAEYEIPAIDLVAVDLYPFENAVQSGADEAEIIENIDIGGVALIRAAAKNFADVATAASPVQYAELLQMLKRNNCATTLAERRYLAAQAFNTASHYDTAIFNYFNQDNAIPALKCSYQTSTPLRYGENPHQEAAFFGNLEQVVEQLHGKEISYNNLLDIDAAVRLIADFDKTTFAIVKHNNACGIASRPSAKEAYQTALACDPVSAYGGVLACNCAIDAAAASEINDLFFEALIAPSYDPAALEILKQKKNRILLRAKTFALPSVQCRTLLGGMVRQTCDNAVETAAQMRPVTTLAPTAEQVRDLIFANRAVKHSKSNAIALAGGERLLACGTGQTSRIDALRHAIDKAQRFGFALQGAAMASDAFFPFPDCVELARKAGIAAIVQPGGSVRDSESIDYCNAHGIAMAFTGVRHFKH